MRRATKQGRAAPLGGGQPGAQRKGPVTRALRRQNILEAARTVFAKRGYHETTIDDIVAEAGVARGTFYLYFEDKRAVFADLIDRFSARITMAIMRIDTADETRSVAEQARANIRAILGVCLAERDMTKVLLADVARVDPAFERKLYTFYDEVVQLLTESLRKGQALGIVSDGQPRVLAYISIGALKELLYQAVSLGLGEESADALTEQVYAVLCRGYLRVEAPRHPKRKARSP